MGGGAGASESSGKSQSQQASQTTSESKTEEQKKWLAELLGLYGPEAGENENVWQGQRVVPFSTLQDKAISSAENYADLFSTPQMVGTPLFKETGSALTGVLSGETGAKPMYSKDVSEYFTSTIYDPTMKSLQKDLLPSIDESYSGPGFWGSDRSHARQTAAEDTRDLLTQQWAGLNWDVTKQNQALEEAKAGRTLTAIPQAMEYGQVPAQEVKNNLDIAAKQIGGLNDLFGIGQAEQTQQQAELEAQIAKFAEENAITDPENLAILMALLGLNFSSSYSKGSGTGSSQSSSSSWNIGLQF